MNPEIKSKWVAALRSGKYKQTKNVLRNRDSFCCLGVLCNLHAKAHPEIAVRQRDKAMYLGNTRFLPVEVQKWAEFSSRSGVLPCHVDGLTTLAEMNDSGKTFEAIAKVIETQL